MGQVKREGDGKYPGGFEPANATPLNTGKTELHKEEATSIHLRGSV